MKSNNTKLALPRILIYQDEDCKILVDYLVYNGFQVITSTENDILIKIREKNYDLCILSHYKTTDASMRLKPLKFLRKSDDKIPVIMVSGKARYEYVIEAFDEGILLFIFCFKCSDYIFIMSALQYQMIYNNMILLSLSI